MVDDSLAMVEQLYQRGRSLRVSGDYEFATTFLRRALQMDPSHARAHMELGLSLCFSGDFEESLRELEQAATLDAINPEICLHLAKTYTMLGMYTEGVSAFSRVLELTPNGGDHHEEAKKQLSYFDNIC